MQLGGQRRASLVLQPENDDIIEAVIGLGAQYRGFQPWGELAELPPAGAVQELP